MIADDLSLFLMEPLVAAIRHLNAMHSQSKHGKSPIANWRSNSAMLQLLRFVTQALDMMCICAHS